MLLFGLLYNDDIRNGALAAVVEDLVVVRVVKNALTAGPQGRGAAAVKVQGLVKAKCFAQNRALKWNKNGKHSE